MKVDNSLNVKANKGCQINTTENQIAVYYYFPTKNMGCSL